jgi:hypothetical protein
MSIQVRFPFYLHPLIMPPKKLLGFGPPMNTWATNKMAHPGTPDMPNPRHPHAEVEKSRQEEAEERKRKELAVEQATWELASIEDDLNAEDNACEKEHIDGYQSSI